MISLNNINLGSINLGGMNTSEIKLGYPSSGCPVPGLKGLQGLYMGKGLTNEMMSRDPVWRDKSGKGNHIALKNFGWKLQSGVGMYEHDFSKKWGLFHSANSLLQSTSIVLKSGTGNWGVKIDKGVGNIVNFKAKLIVEGLDKLNDNHLYFGKFDLNPETLKELHEGLNDLDFDIPSSYGWYGFGFKQTIENANVKITLLPYAYENALCFDGVGDYGETIKDLNFTDNYSVVSLVVPFYRPKNQIIFGKDYLKDVYCNFGSNITFFSAGHAVASYGGSVTRSMASLVVCRRNSSTQNIKDVLNNSDKSIVSIPVIDNPGKYYLGRSQTVSNYGAFAMFAHAIFDHYISDDELQILSDYWKKEFPELFPDQAWTVTGKSNSDADRATIKNITGNGNDLVLTNFGFAENSWYGLYIYDFKGFVGPTEGLIPADITDSSFRITGVGSGGNKLVIRSSAISPDWHIRVSGMKGGDLMYVGNANNFGHYISITKDGIYKYKADYDASEVNGIWYNSSQEVNVLVEQIPDYEGYLVTDGVDDKVISSHEFNLGKDWTMVGDWMFLVDEVKNCGIAKIRDFEIRNRAQYCSVFINNLSFALNKNVLPIKAISSNGVLYDYNWNVVNVNVGEYIKSDDFLYLANYGNNYTQVAFKNLGIYNNTILSKDQCIRAYNYLQTIKNN